MQAYLPSKEMSMGRVFKDPYGQINSIDFHRNHDFLVAGHDEGKITVYSIYEGKKLAAMDCSKYGVAHVTCTHHQKSILHASTKDSAMEPQSKHAVRYLSHHDQTYLQYFSAHTKPVTSLAMSAKSDQFLSGGMDGKVYIWDLRSKVAQAMVDVPGQPYVAMDEEGLVFAIAANGNVVSLFDARSFAHGPFLSFPVPSKQYGTPDLSMVTNMQFSCNQQHLLVTTGHRVFLMDTFSGKELIHWNQGVPDGGLPMEASFSADGQYVISGGEDRCIYVWACPQPDTKPHPDEVNALQVPIAVWPAHPGVPTCAKFAHTRNMAVTACHALVMWIPTQPNSMGSGSRAGGDSQPPSQASPAGA